MTSAREVEKVVLVRIAGGAFPPGTRLPKCEALNRYEPRVPVISVSFKVDERSVQQLAARIAERQRRLADRSDPLVFQTPHCRRNWRSPESSR